MVAQAEAKAEVGSAYDVVIVGAALSGSATAVQLLRRQPELRVLMIEKSPVFERRVGESTVEISSFFLGRVLNLTTYLNHEHVGKQGLRFWFTNDRCQNLGDCSEIGPGYNVRLAGYQVDRAKLDEKLLEDARALGAEIWRPARVKQFELTERAGGTSRLEVECGDELREVSCRWLVDASGLMRLVGRKMGWIEENTAHPIASAWSRWRGVRSLDDHEFMSAYPHVQKRCHGTRFAATNHLVGDGWWSWWIPLKGGDVSIGVVMDERRVQLPEGDSMGARLRALLETHPMARELLSQAEFTEGDVHFRRRLAYAPKRVFGRGFALVGDASAFMDPFYSPGMDWISFTTYGAAHLITRDFAGELSDEDVAELDWRYVRSYRRWFEAIYENKYDYMGDFELMRLAFLLDVGTYYYGVASQPYKHGHDAFLAPPMSIRATEIPFRIIRLYNRRLAAIGRERRRRGKFGRRNDRHAYRFNSYVLNWTLLPRVLLAMGNWAKLELCEGWRTWFSSRAAEAPPRPAGASLSQ